MTPLEIASHIKQNAIKHVDKLWPHDFTGACATVSKSLTLALNAFGYEAYHAMGKAHIGEPEIKVALFNEDEYIKQANNGVLFINHCWTVFNREVWDLTAEQFDYTNPIMVVPDEYESDYHPYIIDPTAKAFRAWPREQRPNKKNIRRLLKWMPDKLFFRVMEEINSFRG